MSIKNEKNDEKKNGSKAESLTVRTMQETTGKTEQYKDSSKQKPMGKGLQKMIMVVGGALVGLAGGFFGGGGGMLCVPLLDKILKVDTKKSHATAMLVILPMSIASAIAYFFTGHFELKNTLIVGAGVMAGGIAGALLLKKLNTFVVALIFSLLMIAAGIKLIFFR